MGAAPHSIGGHEESADDLMWGGRVLAHLGLVGAFGHVSRRTRSGSFEITPPVPLATLAADGGQVVGLDTERLPAGVPGETWMHLAVYRQRSDVGAIVRAQPSKAGALSVLGVDQEPLHGQGALVADRLVVFDDARLVRSLAPAERLAEVLGHHQGLLLRGNGALTVGTSVAHAVARMWILESWADLALQTMGLGRSLSVEEIDSWQQAGDELLDRIWAWLRLQVSD